MSPSAHVEGLHAYVVSSWKWAGDLGAGSALYVMLASHDLPPQSGGGSPRRSVPPWREKPVDSPPQVIIIVVVVYYYYYDFFRSLFLPALRYASTGV